jgi:HPt (histidine-containing phosphotransfer) domain-containing protein
MTSAEQASDPPEPTFDVAVLNRLAEDLGDDAMMRQLVRSYLDQLPDRLQALSFPADADRDQLQLVAHTLKSTSAMFGALDLSRRCRLLELNAHTAPEATLVAEGRGISTCAAETATALEEWLGTA